MRFLSYLALSGCAAQELAAAEPVDKNTNPVTRVVHLIKALRDRITEDEKRETLIYNKFSCWCDATIEAKKKIIADTKVAIEGAERKLKKELATAADAQNKIDDANEVIAEEQNVIAKAIALREKQRATFEANVKEATENIGGLTRALEVLHKGAGIKQEEAEAKKSLIQMPEYQIVRRSISKLISSGRLSQKQLNLAEAIVVPSKFSGDDGSGTYAPQSMTIIGILRDMKDQFKSDIVDWKAEEKKRQEEHDELIRLKEEVIALNQKKVQEETARKAAAEEAAAAAQQLLTSLRETLAHDIEFLATTEKNCARKSEEWTERQRLRQEEIAGIREALDILTGEGARKLFSKAIKAGQEKINFLQVESPRLNAYEAVRGAARKSHSLRLAALAATVKMGNSRMKEIIKSIDVMIQTLDDEEKKDFADREWCQTKQHTRREARDQFKWLARVAQDNADKALREKNQLEKRLAENRQEDAEAKNTIKQLTQERDDEHAAFLQAKSDDEAAIDLLQQVLQSLSKFYDKNINVEEKPRHWVEHEDEEKGNFLQKRKPEFKTSKWQAPDATLSDAGHRQSESQGIISTLEMIVGDLQNEVKQGVKSENESEEEFNQQVNQLEALIRDLGEEEASLRSSIADRDQTIVEEDVIRDDRTTDADGRQKAIDGDRDRCDHAVANFEQRREKRRIEKEGLIQAKNFLAAAPHVALLETPESHFLDNSLFRTISQHIF